MTVNLHQIISFVKHFVSAKRKGHGVHSPFAYRLCEEVFYSNASFYDFKKLNDLRQQLLKDETKIQHREFGAGSKTFSGDTRQIKDIAARGISSRRQSELLYRLLNFLNCQTCVELGTSIGLNTLYMASVNKNMHVITIEANPDLSNFAAGLAGRFDKDNIRFINALFEEALPETLKTIDRLDCLYVDGNHTYTATMAYFNMALAKKSSGSLFVFDDIYWSPGMTKAWQEIIKYPDVKMSIDLFYFGIVFFKDEIKHKQHLRLYI